MTDKEKAKREQLRSLIEDKSSSFNDKHSNEHSCLTVTDTMRLLLEDEEVSLIVDEIKKMAWIREQMIEDNL